MAHRKRPVLGCGIGHRRDEEDAADFETFNGFIGKVLVGIGRRRRDGGKDEVTAE